MQATISKEQRHENILLSLKKLGFLSRSQIQKLHRLGGVRNTNRILKDMDEFLNVVRLNENVYYLNSEGRERVGAQRALKKTHQITHHLLRNSLYIAYGYPSTWQSEVQIKIDGKVFLVADAIFDMAGTKNIIEVDHTQKMNENRNKIKKYKQLLELGVFPKEPKFIWVTSTEYRRKQILKACEGMKARVYLESEFN